jgi:hypothetical protein
MAACSSRWQASTSSCRVRARRRERGGKRGLCVPCSWNMRLVPSLSHTHSHSLTHTHTHTHTHSLTHTHTHTHTHSHTHSLTHTHTHTHTQTYTHQAVSVDSAAHRLVLVECAAEHIVAPWRHDQEPSRSLEYEGDKVQLPQNAPASAWPLAGSPCASKTTKWSVMGRPSNRGFQACKYLCAHEVYRCSQA